jgi:hypothetical protein
MITLTREESQQVLDALTNSLALGAVRYEKAIELLRARLAQPEQRTGDCLLTGVCAAEGHRIQKAQPEPEPVTKCTNSDSWNCKYCRKTKTCDALTDARNFGTPIPPQRNEPEPVAWIYEDDEGRMMFSQMPQNPPLWEPVYRAKLEKNT